MTKTNGNDLYIPASAQTKHPANQGKNTYEYTKKEDKAEEVLPNNIEMIRQAIGMEVNELLKRANLTPNSYYNIINGGTKKPQVRVMRRIAEALGVYPPTDIFEYPTEEHRRIAREAYFRIYGRETSSSTPPLNLPPVVSPEVVSEPVVEKPRVPTQSSELFSLAHGLRVPVEFSAHNAIIFVRTVAEYLLEKDGLIAITIFNEHVKNWCEKLELTEDQIEYLNVVIGEKFDRKERTE